MVSFQKMLAIREFLSCPVVWSQQFHCREHGFNPWSGNKSHSLAKKKLAINIYVTL